MVRCLETGDDGAAPTDNNNLFPEDNGGESESNTDSDSGSDSGSKSDPNSNGGNSGDGSKFECFISLILGEKF